MNKFYFTFGSNSQFPYQNTYLVVIADSEREAVQKFRAKYPDRHDGIVNCSFIYSEDEWEGNLNQKHYPENPVEVIE